MVRAGTGRQDHPRHGGRENTDTEAEDRHRYEQLGQVRTGESEDDECKKDDNGAAGQERWSADSFEHAWGELAGEEAQSREGDQDESGDEGGEPEAVTRAVRGLRVPGDEREQEEHADSTDEHDDVRPRYGSVPQQPDIDQW